ncbi:hypothetical protein [Thiomicrorhabdus sp. Kp2]|uniref:hypothetical protein n=1 Tax=Thiomicrorhabdus sp. Kp2 TaxID=1123518 RepID=UPI0004245C72|nr:hypothetical protein [Thiomicrorhabdus sp. Kp2]
MAKQIDVYLVSSTLHFFWAFMLAKRFENKRDSHLVLIDQYTNRPMQLWNYLTAENTPFISQTKLEGRELGGLKKNRNRSKQFNWVSDFIKNNDVKRVWIGNDRSVLGQWFIKEAKQKDASCVGCFMDDGVFSYLGRKASQSFRERYLDASFKKLIYGLWYDSPITVGASKWIDEAWVMYPNNVNLLLKQKKVVNILPNNEFFKDLKNLSYKAFSIEKFDTERLNQLDVLITLPNHFLFSKYPGYNKSLLNLIDVLKKNGLFVGVKYHPAAGKADLLNVQEKGVWLIPSYMSFELLLPFLEHSKIIGDLSTTLLMANYAGLKNGIYMLDVNKDSYSNKMAKLCSEVGVIVTDLKDLNSKILGNKAS